ncbi:hypothetical protein Pmar_PMAR022984, partial [Perkinsus marinus ATCC 50983]
LSVGGLPSAETTWASSRPKKKKHPLNAQESVRLFMEQQRRALPEDSSAG